MHTSSFKLFILFFISILVNSFSDLSHGYLHVTGDLKRRMGNGLGQDFKLHRRRFSHRHIPCLFLEPCVDHGRRNLGIGGIAALGAYERPLLRICVPPHFRSALSAEAIDRPPLFKFPFASRRPEFLGRHHRKHLSQPISQPNFCGPNRKALRNFIPRGPLCANSLLR